MGTNTFTKEQREQLIRNPYVAKVSETTITYTAEFKAIFYREYQQGKGPSEILRELGFEPALLGKRRVDSIAKNLVNREFEEHGSGKILLTDITYLKLLNGSFMYLSTVKDAFTKQILAYRVSDSLSIDFVLDKMKDLKENHGDSLQPNCTIHSDQGTHYTSIPFRNLFKQKETKDGNAWIQSMSRRGNCWDNAPKESFFWAYER